VREQAVQYGEDRLSMGIPREKKYAMETRRSTPVPPERSRLRLPDDLGKSKETAHILRNSIVQGVYMKRNVVFCLKMPLFFLFTIIIELCIFRDQARVFPLSTLAPALAYLLFILFFRNMAVPIVCGVHKTVLRKLIQAVIIPVLLAFAAFMAGNVWGTHIVPGNATETIETVISVMVIIIVGGAGEEIGWNYYLRQKTAA
jgi:hypothetical protein